MSLPPPGDPAMALERGAMVRDQIEARGVRDARVLEAMKLVPRHCFVPAEYLREAHADHPLPIGRGQTLSQPYIVAYMLETLALRGCERVLEVGAGSGYVMALLGRLAQEACAVELEETLCEGAQERLDRLGCGNVHLRCGDGALGWPEKAPFDAILLSCAAASVPEPLWEQLSEGGRLLLPLGPCGGIQQLSLFEKTEQGRRCTPLLPVSFVPLRGRLS